MEAVIDEVAMHCASTGYGDPERTMIRVDLSGSDRLRRCRWMRSPSSLRCANASTSPRSRCAIAPRRYIDLEAALVEESTRGAFVRAATAAAADADADEAQVLEDALRYGLMALSGAEVGLR